MVGTNPQLQIQSQLHVRSNQAFQKSTWAATLGFSHALPALCSLVPGRIACPLKEFRNLSAQILRTF